MTDRHKGYIVTLRNSVREDDDQAIRTALAMVSGVVSVDPIVENHVDVMARERIRHELEMKLIDAVRGVFHGEI